MIQRILEKLTTHNERMKRESDEREVDRKKRVEMQRRAEASGRPNGIACPVCVSEMGDGGSQLSSGKFSGSQGEFHSQQSVLCPKCGYEGWRVVYEPDSSDPGAIPVGGEERDR